MKVYVASSWRNERHPAIVRAIRDVGFEPYDFRNPALGENGFGWRDLDPDWQSWDAATFRTKLDHEIAVRGFNADFSAMNEADAFVLVMPCGRSAHLELGWAIGSCVPSAILLDDGEPELMYRLADELCLDVDEVIRFLRRESANLELAAMNK